MSIALAVYLASVLDIIKGCAALIAIPFGLTGFIFKLIDLDGYSGEGDEKIRKTSFIAFLIALPIAIFTPTSNVVYIHTAEKVIENPVVQEEAADLYKDLKVIIHNLATKKD